jgi:transcriptional regulator with XRE-family HTH domain
MDEQSERWTALGEAIRARMAALPRTQADVVRASGVNELTVRHLMAGTPGNYRPSTLAKVSKALLWTPESIEQMLRGASPIDGVVAEMVRISDVMENAPEEIKLLLEVTDRLQRQIVGMDRRQSEVLARLEALEASIAANTRMGLAADGKPGRGAKTRRPEPSANE